MTYKDSITASMTDLARDPARVFVGYGLRIGLAAGTLANAKPEQIIETPVAEGLMVSAAIGLSLRGKKPVVYVERADFLLNAMDAIVNHLDKIARLSNGEFAPAVILRVVVGNKNNPLFTGPTHIQDFTEALRCLVAFPVIRLTAPEMVVGFYAQARDAQDRGQSTALFEFKDLL